jgi:hypothetical protein
MVMVRSYLGARQFTGNPGGGLSVSSIPLCGSLFRADDPLLRFQIEGRHQQSMSRIILALLFLVAAQQANGAECGSTANRAGCVGPNGAATYNKNTGEAHTAQPYHSNEVAPGAHAEGWRGNSATKAVEPGCAFVNGRRVCN